MWLCSLKLDSSKFAAPDSEPSVFSKVAEKVPPMAASEETVPPAQETVAPAEEIAEETVPPAKETVPPADETETELPAEAAGSKSPAEVDKVPEVEETPEAEVAKVQEKPLEISGIFSTFDAVKHQQQQKELKEKIIADIEERQAQIAAKVENERMAQQDAWHEAPPEEKEIPQEPEKTAQTPFNAFGAKDSAQLAVKEEVDSSEENDLCVQDLRHCQACKTKSYIRQGLCLNIFCKLYYMGRADSGTRLCARGKLSEGRKWSPQEWVSSGSFAQVEESLLKENMEEALEEVAPYGPPPMKRAKLAIPAGETIVIEDLDSGEVLQPDAAGSAASGSAAVDATNPMASDEMNAALIQASRKKRNKGWKRVRALAERIFEKKMRGEWQWPDIPMPNFAREYLKPVTEKVQDKVYPGRDWTK